MVLLSNVMGNLEAFSLSLFLIRNLTPSQSSVVERSLDVGGRGFSSTARAIALPALYET